MVVIRLSRGGTNKRPFYQILVADKRSPRDGRYLEKVGFYNPIATGGEKKLLIDRERVNYWVTNGAQLSQRVADLVYELDHPEVVEKRKVRSDKYKARKKEKAKAQPKEEVAAAAPAEKKE